MPTGDALTFTASPGYVTGQEGSVVTNDGQVVHGIADGTSSTYFRTLTIGANKDGVFVGLNARGTEFHLGTGFKSLGVGGSFTSRDGKYNGGDLRLHGGTLTTFAMSFLAASAITAILPLLAF